MAIFKKLLEIQRAIVALQKNARAYNYDYLNGDKLLGYVRPLMDAKGLLLLPEVESLSTSPFETRGRSGAQTEVLYILVMKMTWVDAEDGETLSQNWQAAGMNAYDKGFGSALTYAERYYLLKLFHIQTDRDDVDLVSGDRERAADNVAEEASREGKGANIAPDEAAIREKARHTFRTLTDEVLAQAVKAAATKGVTKTGEPVRDWFIRTFNPDADTLADFDRQVQMMKGE